MPLMLNRLIPTIAEENAPESQCGFRANRGTTDTVFVLRQIQEKCWEQNMGLFVAFIELTKDFDTVSREGLWKILAHLGCPPKFLTILRQLHEGQMGQIKHNSALSDSFPITNVCVPSWGSSGRRLSPMRRFSSKPACQVLSVHYYSSSWAGHVARMEDSRMPKAVFFGELREGKYKCGASKKRYKDQLKKQLSLTEIPLHSWQQEANSHKKWSKVMGSASRRSECSRRDAAEGKRKKRKERMTS